MLTRRDFELFASLIKNAADKEQLILDCCYTFKNINPNFKEDKFKEACK